MAAPAKTPSPITTEVPSSSSKSDAQKILSPTHNLDFRPVYRCHTSKSQSFDVVDEYFRGPHNIQRHSKWPFFLRLQGSVTPKMILPLLLIGGWATLITCISKFVVELAVNSVLLTVLGFVVGLALSFRSSTAYERYAEGRKYWAQLLLTSRILSRIIWIHTKERHTQSPELGKSDLLSKLSALNLLNAFAVSLKHRLRFEPSVEYPDLQSYVAHLQTFAGSADQTALRKKKDSSWKALGEYLGVSFAQSNPRKLIKRSKDNLGNLPLEILSYLSAYFETCFGNETLKIGVHQVQVMAQMASLTDVLTGTERVLNTPLPIAYSIAISQITHLYVLALPFQLYSPLGWITIPGTIVAAYIILGLAHIGYQIEDPFGHDVNDLPLDTYCRELAADIDVLTSMPTPENKDFIESSQNKVLFPLSDGEYRSWEAKSVEQIRAALKEKVTATPRHAGFGTERTSDTALDTSEV
jgi:predicted membrane chloride channel (bestrophin family)